MMGLRALLSVSLAILSVSFVKANVVNPNNYFCSVDFVGADYEGECGEPCPR